MPPSTPDTVDTTLADDKAAIAAAEETLNAALAQGAADEAASLAAAEEANEAKAAQDAANALAAEQVDATAKAEAAAIAEHEAGLAQAAADAPVITKITDAGIGTEVYVYGIDPAVNNGTDVAPGVIVRDWANGYVNVKAFTDGWVDQWLTSIPLYDTDTDAAADPGRTARYAVLSTTG